MSGGYAGSPATVTLDNASQVSVSVDGAASTVTVILAEQGPPGAPGISAVDASIVVLSDDALSVTAVVGRYALVSEGTDPYPHLVVRQEFA